MIPHMGVGVRGTRVKSRGRMRTRRKIKIKIKIKIRIRRGWVGQWGTKLQLVPEITTS
jgi:hypothetical protein